MIHVVITDGSKVLVQADWESSRKAEMSAWISRWLRYMTDFYTATITYPDGTVKVRGLVKERT
jgi:hypothetical protein